MSSHSRERLFEMSRSKGDMSDYRSVPYTKSRGELDSRKKAFSSREEMDSDKHRYLKPTRKSLEDRRDYPERREILPIKRGREDYPPTKESYLRNERERDDSFDSRSRDSYSSRGGREAFNTRGTRGSFSTRGSFMSSRGGGRGSYSSQRGGRESYPSRDSVKGLRESFPSSRGSYGYPRGSRDSFSSRGSFSSGRGGAESYSSRGRDSYSSRGRGREAYPSARGRDSYSMRGRESYSARGRESYSTRGGREPYSTRGGRESYSSRGGRDSYSSRGRETYSSRGSLRGASRGAFRGMKRGSKYDDFSSSANSRSYEMSKKMTSSDHEDVSSRSHYAEERLYRMKREAASFHDRDSDRPFKDSATTPRSFTHNTSSSSSSYPHGEKLIKRERASSSSAHFDKERLYYSESSKIRSRSKFEETSGKRGHDDDDDEHEGPPHKQQRLIKREKYREFEDEAVEHGRRSRPEEEGGKIIRERDHEKGRVQDRLKREERGSKGSNEDEDKRRKRVKSKTKSDEGAKKDKDDEQELEEEKIKEKDEEDFEDDEGEEAFDKRRKDRSPSGMKVTIRSDGERAVNSEGFVKSRISGKVFVELQCPHCPGHRSITFKEYRYHLDSRGHRYRFDKLKFKHSVVLRRIRLQQRKELKDIEDKWEKDNSDEFKTTVSRYCSTCKLAYKCLPEDNCSKGIKEHDDSKLHKIQLRYLNPQCDMCRMSFPSRMIYEYHIASIRHLRIRTMSQENGREGSFENDSKDEASKEELDLTNFITMDSVGEDEELGTEQEELDEITGKLEDIEKAEEDAKEGEEEEDVPDGEEARVEDEHFGMDVEEELDHEIDNPEDEEEESEEICGKEFLIPMEAVYCKLCRKAVRLDTTLGESIIDKHCATEAHIDNFNYYGTGEYPEEHDDHFDEEEHLDDERMEEEEEEHHEEAAVEKEELEAEAEEEVEPEKDNGQVDDEEEERVVREEEEEEEERGTFEELMEEHGDDIDLDDAQEEEPEEKCDASAAGKESKQNGK